MVYNGNLAEGFGSRVLSAGRYNGEITKIEGLNHYLLFSIPKDERGLSLGTVGEFAYRTRCHNEDIDLTMLCSKQVIAPATKK